MFCYFRICVASVVLNLLAISGAQAVTFEFEASGTGGATGTTVTGTFGYDDSLIGALSSGNGVAGSVFFNAEISDTGSSDFRGQTVSFDESGIVRIQDNGFFGDAIAIFSGGFSPSTAGFLVQLTSTSNSPLSSNAVLAALPALSNFDLLAALTINADGSGRESFDLTSLSLVNSTVVPLPAGGWLLLTVLGGLAWVARRRGSVMPA